MNGPAVFKFKMEVRFEQFFTVFHSFFIHFTLKMEVS